MGFSFGVHSSGHRRSTLLPDRSKLCLSHWSNQWLTSKIELRGNIIEVSVYGFEHETAAAAILTNLETKLENAGVDPRIPWLGNRRLRFTFH
jgi:hypothetical protein